ncbi:MAG: DpnII family type II restriction endonuclease [Thermotogota bacterium]
MKFPKVAIEGLLSQFAELPADWQDATARRVVGSIGSSVAALRTLGRRIRPQDLEDRLQADSAFLDTCRLLLGLGQEPAAHVLSDALGRESLTWTKLRALAVQAPAELAEALVRAGLPEIIDNGLGKEWRLEDVLIERYRMSRGRAIAGQQRGRGLENAVEEALRTANVPFVPRVAFVGKQGKTAKCDFAIPGKNSPKVVVEVKGFEATGSKLTDFLGDVLKIAQAKDYHMYFFLVTDGRGWQNRESDLRKLVQYQHEGLIDMIYPRRALPQLAQAVRSILQKE